MIAPDDEPQGWVQWRDGSWSPVFADGWTGEPKERADIAIDEGQE
ncbi:hypothetical protein [Nocardia sp. CNY236]|nr:hypothetical protein [Nocardia sp. CNY236]